MSRLGISDGTPSRAGHPGPQSASSLQAAEIESLLLEFSNFIYTTSRGIRNFEISVTSMYASIPEDEDHKA